MPGSAMRLPLRTSEGGAKSLTKQPTPFRPDRSITSLSNIRKMATHNIVVFAGDHCGPEVSSMLLNGFLEIY